MKKNILLVTSRNSPTLLFNMDQIEIDLLKIDLVVISNNPGGGKGEK